MEKVLVIGSNSFSGASFIDHLLGKGIMVLVAVDLLKLRLVFVFMNLETETGISSFYRLI